MPTVVFSHPYKSILKLIICCIASSCLFVASVHAQKPSLRQWGVPIGIIPTGKYNAITDVAHIKVGQITLIQGDSIRTGVTAILPHPGNVFQDKVPAAMYIGNGFGKLTGISQVEELGNIETPIILTNTLSVPMAADALIDYTLSFPENQEVRSVNPVVGETNDGYLNDIRGHHVRKSDDAITPLFMATIEATEEAILNALFQAETMTGRGGHTVEALPLDKVKNLLKKYGRL